MARVEKPSKLPRVAPEVIYKASVERDLTNLTPGDAERIIVKLESVLRGDGRKGEALSGRFEGLFKLRVGEYRVIYTRTGRGYLVLRIGHRREVYEKGL